MNGETRGYGNLIGIAHDGDPIKLQKFGDIGRIPLVYGTQNSPKYVYKEFDNSELNNITCLPESFGGIDPYPNVRKTCYLMLPPGHSYKN